MERTQFVDVDNQGWWLLEPELEQALEERRQALGACWQWTGDSRWYTDPQKLEEVFRFIEYGRPDLLRGLDDAQDVYRRQQWLDDLMAAKNPTGQEESPEPASAGPAAGAEEQVAAQPADGTGDSGQPAASAEATEQPETKKSSLFARKAAAVADEKAEEPAPSGAAAAAPAESTPARDDGQLHVISEQVQNVMADLSTDELAEIAKNLGLTVQQVRDIVGDPAFASAVAAEQAEVG